MSTRLNSGESLIERILPNMSVSGPGKWVLGTDTRQFRVLSTDSTPVSSVYTRSMMVAVPMPPPVHIVTRPVDWSLPLELVEQGADEHAAGGADRMAERHGAAVDVDLVPIDPGLAQEPHHDRGERLVDLEQVDVVEASCPPSRRSASAPGRAR